MSGRNSPAGIPTLAIRHGISVQDVAVTIHVHPSTNEVRRGAYRDASDSSREPDRYGLLFAGSIVRRDRSSSSHCRRKGMAVHREPNTVHESGYQQPVQDLATPGDESQST